MEVPYRISQTLLLLVSRRLRRIGSILRTPTIVDDLQSQETYIWIINTYSLAMCVARPLYGPGADIFGRKPTFITAHLLFLLGSCLCGVCESMAMLIAGRAVQGLGGGGLSVLPGMIICDLVPLRDGQKCIHRYHLRNICHRNIHRPRPRWRPHRHTGLVVDILAGIDNWRHSACSDFGFHSC